MRLKTVITRLFRYLSRYRGVPFVERVASYLNIARRSIDNELFSMDFNGELRVLHVLQNHDIRTIVDVGANKGEWSLMANRLFPRASIYAFEMVPDTLEQLRVATADVGNIHISEVGLSTRAETIDISLSRNSSVSTAFPLKGTRFHDAAYKKTVPCHFDTGANVMEQLHIDHINFMKVDTEGMDLRVIKGFDSRLADIDIIQFEYGAYNIASHDLLYDFYGALIAYDFRVGKIYPRTVIFSEYNSGMENFTGGNYLAVKGHLEGIIEALSRRTKP